MKNKQNMDYMVLFKESGRIVRMNGRDHLSPNFQVWEFAHTGCEIVLVNETLLRGLQHIRDKRGQINIRILRIISFNESLPYASEDSEHLYGDAGDIDCPSCTNEELAQDCDDTFGYHSNIGIYETHVHIGVRGFHRRAVM